jgi:general secretion pathway protein N
MRPLRLIALALAAYAAFLVATIPASIVVPRLAGPRVQLERLEGTVWNGHAAARVALPGTALEVDELRWSFLPARLLGGQAAFALEARAGSWQAKAEVARGLLAWQVKNLAAGGNAAFLAPLLPLASAWKPEGAVTVEAERLAWNGREATGTASVEWRDAALALSALRPLGTWRLEARGDGPAVRLSLSTLRGPLRLSGQGSLPIPGRLAFTGAARAEPAHERDLQPLLDLIGPRRADGARALEVR